MTDILGHFVNSGTNFKMYPMAKIQEAVDKVNLHFQSKVLFPAVNELGPRKINNTEKIDISNYYGGRELKIFERIYSKDIELYRRTCREYR